MSGVVDLKAIERAMARLDRDVELLRRLAVHGRETGWVETCALVNLIEDFKEREGLA